MHNVISWYIFFTPKLGTLLNPGTIFRSKTPAGIICPLIGILIIFQLERICVYEYEQLIFTLRILELIDVI